MSKYNFVGDEILTEQTITTRVVKRSGFKEDISKQQLDSILRNRHNKTARGMTRTLYKSQKRNRKPRGNLSNEALSLSVKGTTDKLGSGIQFLTKKFPCPTCNSTCNGKLGLNEYGKKRLARLRLIREAKEKK